MIVLRVVLITLAVILPLSGCDRSVVEVYNGQGSDELEIQKQMNEWAEAWQSVETETFRKTMKSEGIDVTLTKVLKEKDITIEEFIEKAVPYRFLFLSDKDEFKMNAIKLAGNSSKVYGKWNVRVLDKEVKLPVKAEFEKIDGTWLMASINIGGSP
jgi:hypothetical protein